MNRARTLAWLPAAALALGALALPAFASAATWYANSSTGDDSTGDGSSGSPYKTFHKAYTAASSGDTIDLTGTFSWASADETGDSATTGYTIGKNLTIQGHGPSSTIIQAADADNTADRRVFTIAAANSATTTDLTVRYGRLTGSSQDGAGIQVLGTAYIDSCDISYNRAANDGGGVSVRGRATVINSAVHNNVAYYQGGGLLRHYYTATNGVPSSADTLDVISTTVYSNQVRRRSRTSRARAFSTAAARAPSRTRR